MRRLNPTPAGKRLQQKKKPPMALAVDQNNLCVHCFERISSSLLRVKFSPCSSISE